MGVCAVSDCLNTGKCRVLLTGAKGVTIRVTGVRRPGLVLVSVRVPRISKVRTVRRVQLSPSLAGVPVVTLATLTVPGSQRHYLTTKTGSCLDGPIGLGRLSAAVQQFLDRPLIRRPVG